MIFQNARIMTPENQLSIS